MKNTIKLFFIIAIAAIVGFSMIACGGGGDSYDSALNGTWTDVNGDGFRMNNGNFERLVDNKVVSKGKYTTGNARNVSKRGRW